MCCLLIVDCWSLSAVCCGVCVLFVVVCGLLLAGLCCWVAGCVLLVVYCLALINTDCCALCVTSTV